MRTFIALSAFVLPVMAATVPAPKPLIAPTSRTTARVVKMGDRDIQDIECRIRHSCVLVFPQGEPVSFASGGDVKGRWVMESGNPKRPSNLFSLKPAKSGPDAETNLNIVTTEEENGQEHSYSFRLHSCDKCDPDTKVFVEHLQVSKPAVPPDTHLETISELNRKLATAEEAQVAAEEDARTSRKAASEKAEHDIAAFQKAYPLSMRSDYAYKRNKPPFLVQAIWHDKVHTYIQVAGELSSVYAMFEGKPEIVQFTYEQSEDGSGTYVIDRVLSSGYLSLGKKSKLSFEMKEVK